MDATAIHEAAAATLAGTMPFPQVVAKLMGAGVEYYHVDYVGRDQHTEWFPGAEPKKP